MITLRMAQGIKKAINKVGAKEYIMEGFLEPGLVSYQDVDGGVCRLDKETIDKMLPSFVGCPVTIDHVEESKEEILNGTDMAVKEKKRGAVTKAWWNAETGKYDCSFTVEGQDAAEAVLNGYSGSCAYNVTETGPGGELHAMKYNETILGGEFEHLALVTNPRYEDCRIKLNGKVRMNGKANAVTLVNAQESEEFQREFAKEQKEHPELPAEEIKKIVLDHAREKNKAMKGDRFFDSKQNSITLKNANPKATAEGILQDINPAQITEQAWQIIFREMRELNSKVTLKSV